MREPRGPYASAMLLRRAEKLLSGEHGLTIYELAERLVRPRTTVQKVLDALRAAGHDVIETQEGRRKLYRIRTPKPARSASTFEMMMLTWARARFAFLRGTGMAEYFEELLESKQSTLDRKRFQAMANLARMICAISAGPVLLSLDADDMNEIETALLKSNPLDITFAPVGKPSRVLRVEPYALVEYKHGLYLLAMSRSHEPNQVRTFGCDGITHVERLENEHFDRPEGFDPRTFFDGAFGLMADGPEVEVRIRFAKEVTRFVARRRWHETQSIGTFENGDVDFRIRVRGTTEVRNWVLSFGGKAEVLAPAALRDEVARNAREILRAYEGVDS